MKVYRNIKDFHKLSKAVVTSGFFDGVHQGHQKILSRLVESARAIEGESVVITFWPHPKKVLMPAQNDCHTLSTLEEKIQLIAAMKIDHLIILTFDKEFSQISSDEFVKDILIEKIGTKKLVIGYDHKFGKNREGGFEYLKSNAHQFGFEVEEIPRQDIDQMGISSTLIRKALLEADVKSAAMFLGRNYSLTGTVVKGKQLGATIGYPTANVAADDPEKLIPMDGIYAVMVQYKNILYKGMLSIGFNPTVNGTERTIEVNIFDFNGSIYNETLEIIFIDYLRQEENFKSLEALKQQLDKDKTNALKILNGESAS